MAKCGSVGLKGEAGTMQIVPGDFNDPQILDLLTHHVRTAAAQTAEGSAHALNLDALKSADISFWAIWDGPTLAGLGALKRLSSDDGEIKSMHTAEARRGRGVGASMLSHLLKTARAHGLTRVSLETGSWDYFAPARALYARHGFVPCPPFGDYEPDRNSVFLTKDLTGGRDGDQ